MTKKRSPASKEFCTNSEEWFSGMRKNTVGDNRVFYGRKQDQDPNGGRTGPSRKEHALVVREPNPRAPVGSDCVRQLVALKFMLPLAV